MATTEPHPAPPDRRPPGWLRRIGWLVGIWAASVASLFVAAWLLKGFMRLAGLTG